jgi:Cu(I)/Ag(I) efflux system membrane fusion protein
MDHKDICPLCGMDLTPVSEDSSGPEELSLSEYGRMMARVATAEVTRRELHKELRTVGRVEADETRAARISAWIDGRVDKVYANFPGTVVKKGEHLVSIYSPDLFSTQEEFLLNLRYEQARQRSGLADDGPSLSASSRKRLTLWGITDAQIDELARSGKSQTHLVVYAPLGGTVIEKNIRDGQYVKTGDVLYLLADLSRVWLVLELYESELSWIRVGQPVEVALESEPQRPLTGMVGFVEPVLTEATRTVKVRVILHNHEGKLRPGMYAQALLRVPLLPGGQPAPTGLEGKYVCPMHPYEFSDKPGECPECNMPLEKLPSGPAAEHGRLVLAAPAEAVLTTGRRELVYVEEEPGKYRVVAPKLGPRAGDYYPVLEGLKEGDRVVVRGNFLLDSQFQITGKPSLLYPVGTVAEMNLGSLSAEDRKLAMTQRICPVTGAPLGSMGKPVKMTVKGRAVFLCCQGCEDAVKDDPDGTLKKLGK